MKVFSCCFVASLSLSLFSRVHAAQPVAVTVVERGPHSQVVQAVSPDGSTNTFVELRTGLNRWSETDHQYVPASDEVELVNGVALARKTQYQVIFGTTLDAPEGAADVSMPDGRRFRARPFGIAYTEFQSGKPGKSVYVGETKASPSERSGPSEVTYPDALTGGLSASVRYRVSLSGLEQDIVLASALPPPGQFQMNEALVRVEVWNEILESPTPVKQTADIVRRDGSVDRDEHLAFGAMLIGSGFGFITGGAANQKSIPVARQWQEISGKVSLIESLPYAELKPLLAGLPAAQARAVDRDRLNELWAKQSNRARSLPVGGVADRGGRVALAAQPEEGQQVANQGPGRPANAPGVVLDWSLLPSATNATLNGDTTYYVSGPVTFSSSDGVIPALTIEGGTVVKSTNSTAAQIVIDGPVSCQTNPYRPAAFVSKDRDDVGEKIPGSTGSPNGYYGAGIKIGSAALNNVRFSDLETAITLNNNQTLTLQDAQFVKCKIPLYAFGQTTLNLENVLLFNIDALVQGGPLTLRGAHWTVDQCNIVGSGLFEPSELFLTNSILFAVTNWGFLLANRHPEPDNVVTPNSFGTSGDPNPFQTVGAGDHYLTYDTAFRDAGDANLNGALLERLARKTTYPPCVLVSNFTVNTTLSGRDIRDVTAPDLGWHYESLDYAWSGLILTNATLTLTNGVAVAAYGTTGTILRSGAKFICGGDPIHHNVLTRYHTVQEQANTNWTSNAGTQSLLDLPTQPVVPPEVRLRFTDLSVLGATQSRRHLVNNVGTTLSVLSLEHCQWRGLYLDGRAYTPNMLTISLTNNLIQRGTLSFSQQPSSGYQNYTLNCYNNLFLRGTHSFGHNDPGGIWTVKDNLFDCDSLSGGSYPLTADYNGYRSGLTSLGGSNNKTGLTPDYQTSFLGNFYYPTSGSSTSLTNLFDAGSRSSSSAGLSSYTTKTNQDIEGASTVDIGHHLFGVSTNTTVTISATDTNATEGLDNGEFTVSRTGSTAATLRVFYSVGGSAINGVDYTTLPGSLQILQGAASATIVVTPIDDGLIEPPESVTLTLILTNSYFVGSPDHATLMIQDDELLPNSTNIATLNAPMGIDYHPGNSSLIVSYNWPTGSPKNFKQISATGTQSDWSTLSGVGSTSGETKMGIVPATANGFSQGELYFGTGQGGKIGRISADSSSINTDWTTLTNSSAMVGDTNFPSGLYLDQTGVFGGDLIVVTHRDDGTSTGTGGGVWRVNASTNATRIAQINDETGKGLYLEGVLTVPNDPCRYGSWAGKILTCAEHINRLLTIDVNGNATQFDFGVGVPEALALVVTNQNLFCLNFIDANRPNSTVLKIPKSSFDNFVGDIVVVEEGTASLVFVHWDGVRFVTRRLFVLEATSLEPVTFAPIEAQP